MHVVDRYSDLIFKDLESNVRIAKNTLALYFRMLFNMGVTFYTSRIVLSALGVEDYGIYNVVGGLIVTFSFLNTAMSDATQRFLTFGLGKGDTIERIQNIFSTSLKIHFFISLFILCLGETIGIYFLNVCMVIPAERMFAANWVYQLSLLSCCVGVITLPYNAMIISYERMDVFAYISILETILKLFVAYATSYAMGDKLIFYAAFMLLPFFVSKMFSYLFCIRKLPGSKYRIVKDKLLLKEIYSFTSWNLVGNFAYIGFTQGINILLNLFFGPMVNAARSIAVHLQGAISQFAGNFQIAVNPQITKDYASENLADMHLLIFRSSKFSFFMIYLISLPVFLQADRILAWWLVEVPEYTVSFLRIAICISLIGVLANPLKIGAKATGHIRNYQMVEGGIYLLIFPISYIALCFYPIPELAFIVHLVIATIVQIARLILLKRMINLPVAGYIKNVIAKILLVSMITSLFIYILCSIFPAFLDYFFVSTFSSVLITIILIICVGFTNLERNYLQEKMRIILSKLKNRL